MLMESVFLRLITEFTGAHWRVPSRPQRWPWPCRPRPCQPQPWRPPPCRWWCQARSCQPRTPTGTATNPGTCQGWDGQSRRHQAAHGRRPEVCSLHIPSGRKLASFKGVQDTQINVIYSFGVIYV